MHLVCFRANETERYALLRQGRLHDIRCSPHDREGVARLLADPTSAEETGEVFDPGAVTWLPPVLSPGKIFCVATNFREARLADKPAPAYPLLFTRYPDSLVGHEAALRKPELSAQYDFEGELALIIGQPGFAIPRDRAREHIGGYACFNDGSLRDWQKHSSQFTPGKNFIASGSFGPALVTPDEVPDFGALRLETRVNGVVMQQISMAAMIFDPAWLISYISSFTPLAPGDVIVTGTPSGFGATRTPQVFLKAGDLIEIEIPGLGLLRNRVEAEAFFAN